MSRIRALEQELRAAIAADDAPRVRQLHDLITEEVEEL